MVLGVLFSSESLVVFVRAEIPVSVSDKFSFSSLTLDACSIGPRNLDSGFYLW